MTMTCIGCSFTGPFPVLSPECPEHGAQARALLAEAQAAGTLIARTPDKKCELCGAVAETRPYGPNDEEICVDCGRKDEATTEAKMAKRLGGGG